MTTEQALGVLISEKQLQTLINDMDAMVFIYDRSNDSLAELDDLVVANPELRNTINKWRRGKNELLCLGHPTDTDKSFWGIEFAQKAELLDAKFADKINLVLRKDACRVQSSLLSMSFIDSYSRAGQEQWMKLGGKSMAHFTQDAEELGATVIT